MLAQRADEPPHALPGARNAPHRSPRGDACRQPGAVGFYLLGLSPLYGMTLLGTGVIGRSLDADGHRKLHAAFVGVFLAVAHVAMIFGMLDPGVLGWDPSHVMPDGATMPGMHHN